MYLKVELFEIKKFMNRRFSAIVLYPSSLVNSLTQGKRSMNFFSLKDQTKDNCLKLNPNKTNTKPKHNLKN